MNEVTINVKTSQSNLSEEQQSKLRRVSQVLRDTGLKVEVKYEL